MTDVTANPLQILARIADGLATGRIPLENAGLLANSGKFEGTPPLPTLGAVTSLHCKKCDGEHTHIFVADYYDLFEEYTKYCWLCTHCRRSNITVYDSRSAPANPKSS